MVGSDGFIFLGRLLERLLGVAVGGMCGWLGYRLFARVRDTAAAGKLDFPGGSVFLTNVGPGAFFALFGAAIVALSISKAVTLDSKLQTSHGAAGGLEQQVFTRHVSGLAPPVPGAAPSGELARAREQVFVLNRDWPRALKPDLTSAERRLLEAARDYSKVQILKSVWDPKWGPPSRFDDWLRAGGRDAPAGDLETPAKIYLDGAPAVRTAEAGRRG